RAVELRARKPAVALGDRGEALGVALGQALDDVDRAMLAAGAADGDGEIAAIVRFIFRNATVDEAHDVVDQPAYAVLSFKKTHHFRVTAGEAAQARLPVRIRQRACVEHEVGVSRYAVLEPEGLKGQR